MNENVRELTDRLKSNLIKKLTYNVDLDLPYFTRGENTYTRRQLAEEIEKETEIGLEVLTNSLMLSLDLISRQKN